MKRIRLANSDRVFIVDDQDYQSINLYSWFLTGERSIAGNINGKSIQLSHFIYNFHRIPFTNEIDHKDRDIFNNQKSNLRPATIEQQRANREKQFFETSSPYKGVSFESDRKKWRVSITVNKQVIRLGRFDTEIEAAKEYDKAAVKHFGEFACLNFK